MDDLQPTTTLLKQNDKTLHSATSTGAQDTCVICLCAITRRAVASPCNHLTFDFSCLVSWLTQHAVCPLCKANVNSVQYDWCSPTEYRTYLPPCLGLPGPVVSRSEPAHRVHSRRRRIAAQNEGRQVTSRLSLALARRQAVYTCAAAALYQGTSSVSGYIDLSPQLIRGSSTLRSRARIFLRRELSIFSFLSSRARAEWVLEFIIGMLKSIEIKSADGAMENMLSEYLGRRNSGILLHELEAWLRSPYTTLQQWDESVQYLQPELAHEHYESKSCRTA